MLALGMGENKQTKLQDFLHEEIIWGTDLVFGFYYITATLIFGELLFSTFNLQ